MRRRATRLYQRDGRTAETTQGVKRLTVGDKLTAEESSYGLGGTVAHVHFNPHSVREVHAIYTDHNAVTIYVATGHLTDVVHPAHLGECWEQLAGVRRRLRWERSCQRLREAMAPQQRKLDALLARRPR